MSGNQFHVNSMHWNTKCNWIFFFSLLIVSKVNVLINNCRNSFSHHFREMQRKLKQYRIYRCRSRMWDTWITSDWKSTTFRLPRDRITILWLHKGNKEKNRRGRVKFLISIFNVIIEKLNKMKKKAKLQRLRNIL